MQADPVKLLWDGVQDAAEVVEASGYPIKAGRQHRVAEGCVTTTLQ